MNIKKITIGKVLLVLVLVTIYANIGYWLGTEEQYSNVSTSPNIVQLFLQGPEKIFYGPPKDSINLTRLVYVFFWPIFIGGIILAWLVYLTFFGGLFKVIGTIPSILLIMISIICARRTWVNHQEKID